MAARRVAITGLGIISPLGLDLPETWSGLREGRSAIGPIQLVDGSGVGLKIQNGAQIRSFDPLKHFQGGKDAQLDRFAQFSVVAAREALRDLRHRADSEVARGVRDRLRLGRWRTGCD